jgi:hypothetical protein
LLVSEAALALLMALTKALLKVLVVVVKKILNVSRMS